MGLTPPFHNYTPTPFSKANAWNLPGGVYPVLVLLVPPSGLTSLALAFTAPDATTTASSSPSEALPPCKHPSYLSPNVCKAT
eukprot:759451-Hanusia_phi.AAC.1